MKQPLQIFEIVVISIYCGLASAEMMEAITRKKRKYIAPAFAMLFSALLCCMLRIASK